MTPKPNLQSRLFLLTMAGGGLATLAAGLPSAGAPSWVSLVVGSVSAACSAGVLYLRSQDVKQARARRTVGEIMAAKDKERQ